MEFSVSPALAKVREATRHTEYENRLFLVGGTIRDRLLGLPLPNDYDLVLEGDALAVADLLWRKKLTDHAPVVYPRFGTAMLHIDGVTIELVSARAESYEKESRKPLVRPATLKDDALRRDFTINTLMENLHTGELLDPLGSGIEDLKRKIIRTPLEPSATFSDDPLRMLRAIRFAVKLHFEIDPGCYAAIKQEAPRLKIISFERIRDELLKMMGYPNCADGLRKLLETGLLRQFAPELADLKGVTQNEFHIHDVWDHTMAALENAPPESDAYVRLGILFHDIGKKDTWSQGEDGKVHFYQHEHVGAEIARTILQRLRFSTDEIERISGLVKLHMRPGAFSPEWSEAAVRRLMRDAGDLLDPLLLLCRADASARREDLDPPDFPALQARIDKVRAEIDLAKATSPLSGQEIMAYLQLPPGPQVGHYKNALTDAVVDGRLAPNDKESAYQLLEQMR